MKIAQREGDIVLGVEGTFRLGKESDRLDSHGLNRSPLLWVAYRCPGQPYDKLMPIVRNLPDLSPQVSLALRAPDLQEHAMKITTCHELRPRGYSDHTILCFPPPETLDIR